MNSAHRKTLVRLFDRTATGQVAWTRIEDLFLALGAQIVEGRDSRLRLELNGVVATFHRPHPEREVKPYQVRDARRFLEQAGVKP